MGEEGAAEALANPQDTLRKRGRLRGYPKSGGRQKGTRNWSQPEIRAELLNQSDAIPTLAAIARGDKLFVSGPTGKAVWRHPTMKERLHALDLVFAKVVPDLKASEVTGAGGAPLLPPAPSDTRSVSLAVPSLLRETPEGRATIQAARAAFGSSRPQSDTSDVPADELAAALAASAAPAPQPERAAEREPELGESEVFDNGASITFVETPGSRNRRWMVLDAHGTQHGYKTNKHAAIKHALRLSAGAARRHCRFPG
jgi:hypothetical protein